MFHAGTSTNERGELVSRGGRVLGVTALGADAAEAQRKAYEVIPFALPCSAPATHGIRRNMRLACSDAHAGWLQAVDTVRWADGFCRRDIGWRAVSRQ